MNIPPRNQWIKALTVHSSVTLQLLAENLVDNWEVNHKILPQSGLSLLQIEDGVFYEPYYLGEIPLASAQIELINNKGESFLGAAQVMADSADLAVALAVCDAIMAHQLQGWQQVADLIVQGMEERALEEVKRGAMLAKTRVNFSMLSEQEI